MTAKDLDELAFGEHQLRGIEVLVEALVARQGQSEAQISIVGPPVVVYDFVREVGYVLGEGDAHGFVAAPCRDGCRCWLRSQRSYAQGRAAIGAAPGHSCGARRLALGPSNLDTY